jgi:hypothetical protein
MSPTSADPYRDAQQHLATWRSTHPRPTLAELEAAVEAQVAHLRAHLLQDEIGSGFREEQPLCRGCGATMERRTRAERTLLLPREEPLILERDYLVCPQCGAGLFPPG